MQNFINSLNSVVWGLPMLLFFLFTALRFSFKSSFFQFRGFGKMLSSTIGNTFKSKKETGVSQWGAFCSVLGACIGTGNIVGVATAIYYGGPGTVFWMWAMRACTSREVAPPRFTTKPACFSLTWAPPMA